MDKRLFERLVQSMQQHEEIRRGARAPLQVYLDEADLKGLEAFAKARGWTKSQTIRAAIRALTRQPGEDPLLELSGDIDGLPPDLSEQFHRGS